MESLHLYVLSRIKAMSLAERKVLANEADVSYWTLNKYAYEQVREPSGPKLERIARALHAREGTQ
jgi:hypothetical protein